MCLLAYVGGNFRHLELHTNLLLKWRCMRADGTPDMWQLSNAPHTHTSFIQHEMQVTLHIHTNIHTPKKKKNYKLTSVSYSRKKYSTPKVENKTRSERGKKKMIRHHFLVIVSSCQQLEITEQWWIYNLDSRRTTEERFKSTSQSN